MPDLLCTECRQTKKPEEFHLDKRRASGRTSRCIKCRAALQQASKYPTACATCGRHRRLDPNQVCGKCNEAAGLRYCRGPCAQALPALLSFYGRSAVCKDCWKAAGW